MPDATVQPPGFNCGALRQCIFRPYFDLISKLSRTVSAGIDLKRAPHKDMIKLRVRKFANGSAIARNQAQRDPQVTRCGTFAGSLVVPPRNPVMEIQRVACVAIRPFKMYCHSLQNSVLPGSGAQLRLWQADYSRWHLCCCTAAIGKPSAMVRTNTL
jgi:hypothetical protein